MTKLSGFERWVIVMTLVFSLATVLWFFYHNQDREQTQIVLEFASKVESEPFVESKVEAPGILAGEKININTAPAEDLERLPGIGPQRAEKIIAYREEHGAFQLREELMQISGIGEKTFEKLSKYITVSEE